MARINLPRRITTILEGESLLNDATALVSLRTALAAAGLTAHGVGAGHGGEDAPPEVTIASVGIDLLVASVGGVAIRVLAYLVIGLIQRRLITEVPADTALSFVAPYLSYVPAEQVGASGVLAVVTADSSSPARAPGTGGPSRLSEKINWSSVTFVLEPSSFSSACRSQPARRRRRGWLSLSRTLLVGLAVLATCLVLQPVWMLPSTLPAVPERRGPSGRVRGAIVGSWAGMRGVVTLAATPHPAEETRLRASGGDRPRRDRGHSPPPGHDAPGACPRPRRARPGLADALQEATVLGATTGAGLRLIGSDPDADPAVVRAIQQQARARVSRGLERLGTLGPGDDETQRDPGQAALRDDPGGAGRGAPHPRPRQRGPRGAQHRAQPARRRGDGPGLGATGSGASARLSVATAGASPVPAGTSPPPRSARRCRRLLPCLDRDALGAPAGLRCLRKRGAATRPRATTPRPTSRRPATVMRSIEPGEAWRWCFVDEVIG